MGASRVNLFNDHLFVKASDSLESLVRWYQDQPYCAIDVWQFSSGWAPLDLISEEMTVIGYFTIFLTTNFTVRPCTTIEKITTP